MLASIYRAKAATITATCLVVLIAFTHSTWASEDVGPDHLAFFESEIRPTLAANCYECHSSEAEKIKGGFLLDSKPALLRGGDSGAAIVPGDADASRLIQMVKRHPDYEAMPPKSKLSQNEIENLITWINHGAPDPRTEESSLATNQSNFDLEKRKQWWSLQPIKNVPPPEVGNARWPSNTIDHFILAKLEENGWQPAQTAERRTLLRRLSFDLIGLAPTAEELNSFLKDKSKSAYRKQVDRLLDSPHFGEKWARHWMDLTRYAETKAFEQDYTMAYAWRYRDYLIQAFNDDVPYDQFILESLAGDLIKRPRHNPKTGDNESIKGPGFIYLTDGQHGPPDLHGDEARIFDGMIDTISKAFLGTTVACARCHDHKFDAVTTADYYSLYGILRSSRLAYHNTVSEELQENVRRQLETRKPSLQGQTFDAVRQDVVQAGEYLASSLALAENPDLQPALASLNFKYDTKKKKKKTAEYLEEARSLIRSHCDAGGDTKLDPDVLANWTVLQLIPEFQERWPELVAIHKYSPEQKEEELSASFAEVASRLDAWTHQGLAFSSPPKQPGEIIVSATGPNSLQGLTTGDPVAGHTASRISGAIRSPDFIIDGKPIELQVRGKFASVRLVIRNYELTGRGPTTNKLYFAADGDHWQTVRMETYLWEGESAYLEVFQNGIATHSIHPRDSNPEYDDNAYLTFRFHKGPDWKAFWQNQESLPLTLDKLWRKAKGNRLSAEEADLLSAFFGAGLLSTSADEHDKLDRSISAYRKLAKTIPQPRFARGLTEGIPRDEPVYIRGHHKNLSQEPNPRRWLDGLGGAPFKSDSSGRLEWASHVASPDNPLTARVLVNRIWKHLFGAGLVATVNNFGKMGQAPSHPELLDTLAGDFMRNGWSIKALIRQMVLSRTYQMSSESSEASLLEDPANRLLQHMPVKRLEAEAIRDHILACSNELDTTLFGPSVAAFVDNHPDSRAKPKTGPLDGNGRRSVYLEMRRNFLPTFLRAFDLPNATEPIGARQVTNVPAQSLSLLNDPFVHEQSRAWASKLLEMHATTDARIHQLHTAAYGRPARDEELKWARNFLESVSNDYTGPDSDVKIWTDLCHLMYNRKEFIYLF